MEIDGLGARCHLPTCRTLDFLPLRCPNCQNQFCRDHHLPASHSCQHAAASSQQVPVCPLCRSPVAKPPGVTSDEAVSRHIDLGCPKRTRNNPICASDGCSTREAVPTKCVSCGRVFCLQHRLEMDHDCTGGTPSAVVGRNPFGQLVFGKSVSGGAVNGANKFGGGKGKAVKSIRAEARLQFVNDRASAIGDPNVDQEHRVNVVVFFPMGSSIKPRYMFFNHKNSAGKIIDDLKRSIKQLDGPRQGGRYCLYVVKRNGSGVNLLPHITPLKDLPVETLADGDILVLEESDGGLDHAWLDVLRSLATTSNSLPSPRSSLSTKIRLGKKTSKGKSDKCAVS